MAMTADAFVMDWDHTSKCEAADPDATWVDLFKGQRGRKLPGAKTAFLPPAVTQNLKSAPLAVADLAELPAAHTCLGQLVSEEDCPREDVATVFAFEEGVVKQVEAKTAEPTDLPGLRLSEPRLVTPQFSIAVADAVVEPVLEPVSGLSVPDLAMPAPESSPAVVPAPAAANTPDAQLQAGLQGRCAPFSLVPDIPTWAGCATQMEGPGVWIDEDLPVPVLSQPPRGLRAPDPAPVPQVYVPTQIAALEPAATAMVHVACRRNPLEEALPFSLVLVAISLATAALVGAYM